MTDFKQRKTDYKHKNPFVEKDQEEAMQLILVDIVDGIIRQGLATKMKTSMDSDFVKMVAYCIKSCMIDKPEDPLQASFMSLLAVGLEDATRIYKQIKEKHPTIESLYENGLLKHDALDHSIQTTHVYMAGRRKNIGSKKEAKQAKTS